MCKILGYSDKVGIVSSALSAIEYYVLDMYHNNGMPTLEIAVNSYYSQAYIYRVFSKARRKLDFVFKEKRNKNIWEELNYIKTGEK